MPEPTPKALPGTPEEVRMTVGEHLDELRTRLIRSLVALVIACLVCIWPAKFLLVNVVARPVVLALKRHGQPMNFLATSPVETIVIYIKVVLFCGVLLAAPYILHQAWGFIAAGLYRHERAWVQRLVPVSVVLFLAGVVFMYSLVLLVSLNFLVGFSSWFPLPRAEPTQLERMMLQMPAVHAPATQPGIQDSTRIPVLATDPADPPVGAVWLNLSEQKLKLRAVDGVYGLIALRDDQASMITTHFKIGDYLTFVGILTIAFGLAFQIPLVVVFLARTGIVSTAMFRAYRKFFILGIVIIAGMIAPPDLLSHLLLSGPMLLLFEVGLWWADRQAPPRPASE